MPVIPPPRLEGSILLGGTRQLGYAEYGAADGRPLIWFHGTPGARGQIAPRARRLAGERGVRLIAIERPGIGASTPHVYASLADWAVDIERFGDALGLGHFALVGLSGGGPYALACAHRLPERVVAVLVLGGVAPSVGPDAARGGLTSLAPLAAPFLRCAHRPLGRLARCLVQALEPFGDRLIDHFSKLLPPGDQRIFEDPGIRRIFQDDLLTGSRSRMQAFLLDAALFGRPWGFELGEIRVPVHLWYGDADNIVPIEHGRHLAARIPDAHFLVREQEGHLGGLGAADEILDTLLAEWPAAAKRAGAYSPSRLATSS